MEDKLTKVIPIILLAAALLIIGFYYFYFYQNREQIQSAVDFQKERKAAKDLIYKKGDNKGASNALENLLGKVSAKDEEALLKTDIAFTAFRLRDFKKGAGLFKEIAENKEYSPERRAYAVKAMADWFMLGSRAINSGLADEIFAGDKYSKFLIATSTSKNTKVLIGMRRLYDYSASISANAVSEYRSAEWFAKRVANAKLDKKVVLSGTNAHYIELIKKRIADGDALLYNAQILADEGETYLNKTELGYAKWVQAETLGLLGELTGDKKYFTEADIAFKNSLSSLASSNDQNVAYTKSNVLWADFYYSVFLSRAYGKARESDVKQRVAVIVASSKSENDKDLGLLRYLKRLGTLKRPGGMRAYDIAGALALAKIDQDFTKLLKDLGWKI